MNKYINQFLKYLSDELNYSNYTIKNYQIDLNSFFDFAKDNKVTFDLIRDYLAQLHMKDYSKKTIARKISALKSFYKYLYNEQLINDNPTILLSNPKLDKKLPKVLNYEELAKILDCIDDGIVGIRNKLVLEMLYSTGIRVSELVNIKIEDIDIGEKKIRILGKGNKERIVYFGTLCLEKLNDYLKIRDNFNINGNQYLFLNKQGNKLSDRSVRFIIEDLALKANLKMHISPHVLRHTFATHMLNEGADLKSVQELLGHENLSTTQIYTHVSNEHLRKTYLNCHPRAKKRN